MKLFFSIKNKLDKALSYFLGFLVLAISLIVLWQVFTRFVLNNPSSWSEEFSRYILIWISLLGGSLGLSNGTHMGLVVVTDRIKNQFIKTLVHIFAYVVCGGIGYIFVKYGYAYALNGMNRTMMCCKLKMGYIYMMIPVCGVIMILNCIEIIAKDIISICRNKEETAEDN